LVWSVLERRKSRINGRYCLELQYAENCLYGSIA